MTEATDIIALAVLAGLLSLLPVVILFWVYYLKEREPSVPGRAVTKFFAAGMLTVFPALLVERGMYAGAKMVSPHLARAFFTEFFTLERASELGLALLVGFGVVALVEELLRYLLLRYLFLRSEDVDQVVDGIQLGVAAGLGFAFVENTLYFFRLFQGLEFSTLAIVFFLRFLISTFGHISFAGIMGYHLARALADPVGRRTHLFRAFWMPWAIHGLFDVFLSIRFSAYTVAFLMLPIAALWLLYRSPQLQERFRLAGRYLRAPIGARPRALSFWRKLPVEVLPLMPWCPTCLAQLPGREDAQRGLQSAARAARCPSCGTRFRERLVPAVL